MAGLCPKVCISNQGIKKFSNIPAVQTVEGSTLRKECWWYQGKRSFAAFLGCQGSWEATTERGSFPSCYRAKLLTCWCSAGCHPFSTMDVGRSKGRTPEGAVAYWQSICVACEGFQVWSPASPSRTEIYAWLKPWRGIGNHCTNTELDGLMVWLSIRQLAWKSPPEHSVTNPCFRTAFICMAQEFFPRPPGRREATVVAHFS